MTKEEAKKIISEAKAVDISNEYQKGWNDGSFFVAALIEHQLSEVLETLNDPPKLEIK